MRKTIDVKVTPETAPSEQGRDNDKVFRITEMPAKQGYKWAMRATLALLPRLSREIDPDIAEQLENNPSMSTLSRIGVLLGGVSFPETEALLDELMTCVQIVEVSKNNPNAPGRARELNLGGAEDIEEVATHHFLRKEALAIHTDFTLPAAIFNLMAEVSRTSPF